MRNVSTVSRCPSVHRIGRTGRGGRDGIATTFINKTCSETVLLDLKHLLIEAKQRVPPVLAGLEEGGLLGDGGTCTCSFSLSGFFRIVPCVVLLLRTL